MSVATASQTHLPNVIKRFYRAVEEGQYYEAHQQCKTISKRLQGQRKIKEAAEYLRAGAERLLEKQQYESGVDLGLDLTSLYSKSFAYSAELLGNMAKLLSLMPKESANRRKAFISAVLNWSNKFVQGGSPQFHHLAGVLYFKEEDFKDAEAHFSKGTLESAKTWAALLFTHWHAGGNSNDHATTVGDREGLILLPALICYLSERKINHAKALFKEFSSMLKTRQIANVPYGDDNDKQMVVFQDPLMNFAQLLLEIVQRDARDIFILTRDHYKRYWSPYADLAKGLERLGATYFNIRPAGAGGGPNFMQEIMQSMFNIPNFSAPALTPAPAPQSPPAPPRSSSLDLD